MKRSGSPNHAEGLSCVRTCVGRASDEPLIAIVACVEADKRSREAELDRNRTRGTTESPPRGARAPHASGSLSANENAPRGADCVDRPTGDCHVVLTCWASDWTVQVAADVEIPAKIIF